MLFSLSIPWMMYSALTLSGGETGDAIRVVVTSFFLNGCFAVHDLDNIHHLPVF